MDDWQIKLMSSTVKGRVDENYLLAQQFHVIGDIGQLSADGLSYKEIAKMLSYRITNKSLEEIETLVNDVKLRLRIPLPGTAQFEEWQKRLKGGFSGKNPKFKAGDEVLYQAPDGDFPTTITGIMGEHEGEIYYSVEGSNTGIKESQLVLR